MATPKSNNLQPAQNNEHATSFSLPDPGPSVAFVKVRRMSLLIGFVLLLSLVLYQFLFSPSPTVHPFIMQSLEEPEVLRALNWYGENSVGSLQLPETESCLFNSGPHLLPTSNPACSVLFNDNASITSLIQAAKEEPALKPYIWRDTYDTIHIALFTVRAENLISFKKENSILGAELDVHATFKRIQPSPIIEKLKRTESESASKSISSLQQLVGLEFSHHVRMKKYQSGYHLSVPPLP